MSRWFSLHVGDYVDVLHINPPVQKVVGISAGWLRFSTGECGHADIWVHLEDGKIVPYYHIENSVPEPQVVTGIR